MATFVALVSHVVGGGQLPGALGILVPLLLSVFVCVLLTATRLSLWRLGVSVAASQLLFHLLFALGTSRSTVASPAQSEHAHSMELVMSSPGMSHDGPAGIWMWVAHGVAALITIAALHRGETVIAGLLGFTGHVVARIERAFSALVIPSPRSASTGTATWFEHRSTPLGVYASVCLQRGPPALSGS